jgi:hypothetical protein
MQYGYLVGSLLLGCIYLFLFLKAPNIRLRMIQGGLFLAPFAFLASFYIPEYWNPPYAFGFVPYINTGIEDLLFCFFTGGIVLGLDSVINGNEGYLHGRTLQLRSFASYILGIFFIVIGEILFPARSIVILGITGPAVVFCMPHYPKAAYVQSFRVGLAFCFIYFIFFSVFLFLFPTYISTVYTRTGNFGIAIMNIPIEELLFAFSAGLGWTFAYTCAVSQSRKK